MFAITGATGHLGRLTIATLLKHASPERIIALVRDPSRAADLASLGIGVRRFDYNHPADLGPALAGVERLLLISSDDIGGRVPQHRAVLDAAVAAGVGFVAYTSVLSADDNPLAVAPSHRETETMLRDSGLAHAILRNGWYHENYLLGAEAAIAHGTLLGSTGDGRISGAARIDYAEGAAAVLVAGPKAAGIHELAGDEPYTLADVAAALADASGRPVTYRDLPEAHYALALEQGGVPAPFATVLAGLSAGASGGILADGSHTLSRLIGRQTTSLRDIVQAAIGRVA